MTLPLLSMVVQGRLDLNLMDEGYLWYGVQRVLAGEVPLRDFHSYDIGRYYGLAAALKIFGADGVWALRVANAGLQAVSLLMALQLVRRAYPEGGVALTWLVGCTLLLWMTPLFKAADFAACIGLLYALCLVFEKPVPTRCFGFGVALGLIAIVGRNHGVYGAAAGLGALAYLVWQGRGVNALAAVSAALAGLLIGYLPMLVALLITPGFAAAVWEGIRWMLFEAKSTNLGLPIPWPWTVTFKGRSTLGALVELADGICFVALAAVSLGGLVYAMLKKRQFRDSRSAVFLSGAFLSLPYAHYAFSRADSVHLALGAFPALIAAYALLLAKPRISPTASATALLLCSLVVMVPEQPAFRAAYAGNWEATMAGRDTLRVPPKTHEALQLLSKLTSEHARAQPFLVVPFWAGAYAVHGQRSPIWELFATNRMSADFERAEIARVKAADPAFVLIVDTPWDGREDLRYGKTHPLMDQYVRDHFVPLSEPGLSKELRVYLRKRTLDPSVQPAP